jgi:uncharacterized membrane protein YbhN (UPF0104 family)
MTIDREDDIGDPAAQTGSVMQRRGASGKRSGILYRLLAVCFSLIVFAASVWFIGRTFEWGKLAQVLRSVNLAFLVVAGGASIIAYWALRTLRWHILLRRTDTHVPFLDLYMCTAVALSFAIVTPLQSGEMLKIELLRKYGMIGRFPGYGSFLVERAFDMAVLMAMACLSLLTTVDILPNRNYAYGILGCVAVACLAGLIMLPRLRLRGRPQQLVETMRQCVGNVPTLIMVTAITCVSWACVAFSWQVFLYSGGIHVSFAKAVALMSIVALISILSLIPGGLGVSEVGTSQMLMHFGFAPAVAQAGSLVLRCYSLVAIALGAGHLGLWKLVRSRRSRRLAGGQTATERLAVEPDSPTS